MKKRDKINTKEAALELGLILGKYFLKTEYLHFGYWTDDLPPDIWNMARAQENYADLIMSNIPQNVKTILEVGCGSGKFAEKLVNTGYKVDCVSPRSILTEHARKILGDRCTIYESYFEQFATDKRYDLVLFSESFQYIDMDKAFQNCVRFLNPGGHILICDFFKTEAEGRFFFGGGHRLKKFLDTVSAYPFSLVKEIDITRETARNMDILGGFLLEAGLPVWNLLSHYLKTNYPRVSKFLKWKFRKKIEKLRDRYFTGKATAENFIHYQTYRLFVYKKNE